MNLTPKDICSGCAACQSICPKEAILMVEDKEGFLYPRIDESKCIRCGLCEKVCPSVNRDLPRTPLAVYAAKAKDDELRLRSSSGGVFSLLARQVIARGGVVYGAGFDYDDWHVMHKSAENEEELEDLRGSKYVQSDVQGVYAAVKAQLLAGREVLFSGTPCQVAGLRRYLNALNVDVLKLLLVDVVCHAVPSPMAWQRYLDEREAALAGGRGSAPAEGRNIRRISFRHKNCGWKRFSLSLRFANDREYLCDLRTDPFLRGFLSELYNRPSCHNCQCRELRSGSDLTIADYWRVHERFPELDDDMGTSLVLINNEKGTSLFQSLVAEVDNLKSSWDDALLVNPAIVVSSRPHSCRARFFGHVIRGGDFDSIVEQLLRQPLLKRGLLFLNRTVRWLINRR